MKTSSAGHNGAYNTYSIACTIETKSLRSFAYLLVAIMIHSSPPSYVFVWELLDPHTFPHFITALTTPQLIYAIYLYLDLLRRRGVRRQRLGRRQRVPTCLRSEILATQFELRHSPLGPPTGRSSGRLPNRTQLDPPHNRSWL